MIAGVLLAAAAAFDLAFLREMLVEAAHPPGSPRPVDPLADDEVARYLDGWGRPGDLGLVAWSGGERLGAAWTRIYPLERAGYGFVDEATPELTVGVRAEHRGAGLGRALVVGALDLAATHGHPQVSLSVADATNPTAAHLYRRVGFVEHGRDEGGSLTMTATTAPLPPPTSDGRSPTGAPSDSASAASWPIARLATPADGPALARLREHMLASLDQDGQPAWVPSFLRSWTDGLASETFVATVVDGCDRRPVASALAAVAPVVPGPGREGGLRAHVGSVATEPEWRGRGAARAAMALLVDHLDRTGVVVSSLTATPQGEPLYRQFGFARPELPTLRRSRPDTT